MSYSNAKWVFMALSMASKSFLFRTPILFIILFLSRVRIWSALIFESLDKFIVPSYRGFPFLDVDGLHGPLSRPLICVSLSPAYDSDPFVPVIFLAAIDQGWIDRHISRQSCPFFQAGEKLSYDGLA